LRSHRATITVAPVCSTRRAANVIVYASRPKKATRCPDRWAAPDRAAAHGRALAQRLDHLAHARQGGGHGLNARTIARGFQNFGQPALACGAVEHGDCAMPIRPAPRCGLHRHLEAAQVRREKHNALATRIGLLGTAPLTMSQSGNWPSQMRGISNTMRPACPTAALTWAKP
jgi:hypothetical protein